MLEFRPFNADDLDSLYAISAATGWAGADAAAIYRDPKLVGHLHSAAYALLKPGPCTLAEDEQGVCGYVLGASDTSGFEDQLEREWWPQLRPLYPDPTGIPRSAWTPDQTSSFAIHHPERTPRPIAGPYPAHVHLNLLPRIQGQGIGPAMLDLWLAEAGVTAVHVGCDPDNHRAIRFWESQAFQRLPLPEIRTIWLGRTIGAGNAMPGHPVANPSGP